MRKKMMNLLTPFVMTVALLFGRPTGGLVPASEINASSLSSLINTTSAITKAGSSLPVQVDDDNFDVIDPSPAIGNPPPSVINKIPLDNKVPVTSSKSKKVRKWDHHRKKHHSGGHHTKSVGVYPAADKSFWSNNDILSSSTSFAAGGSDVCEVLPAVIARPSSSSVPVMSCPPSYRLLERRKEYEIRWYPSHKWASAIVMSSSSSGEEDGGRILAFWEGLAKLEQYFGGYNEPAILMNLSYPLLTQMKHGKHPGIIAQELKDITLSAPVPANHQISPPMPVSADVVVDVVEASTVFVQSFRARLWDMTDRAIRHRADKFMTTLRNHGEAFHDRYYYLAAFNKPDNTESNVYELWIHATRLRDPSRVKPALPRGDPPINKVTSRTKKRLCRGVECPPFDVLRVYKFGIQKRRYFDTVLVQASTSECELNSLSVWRGFMPLHLYKHGINSHWEVLEATRPIGIVHVQEKTPGHFWVNQSTASRGSNVSHCKHDMTASLYLPQRLHSNPPTTGFGAPSVKINRVEDLVVYVQTVGGSILDPVRSSIEVRKFGSRLSSLGLCFKKGQHYLVIYDFMVRFHGRQNEIWMLADRCSSSNNSSTITSTSSSQP